ncbi:sodium:proton antiporter [Enterovibrio norvegicus FF-33]|uniref:Sodium:proton antiporter n=1 Tax=Enterovibrio norvegicus FF-454 TaxID=1185651 RepID=A0A1E5CFK0_9GAMM|nr:Na+/H+ antiporter NhaC family protein [Enterovibrio norvegicus]OEE64247.1 sodium:proton antiporter [Enterovibrio norvegicus FF-454]OEE70402.1 sodium:proton antiporter [Enterovibrio norvegicus FF-33]OEE85315.1 sodium:proton antiporter [Enterovibrio norvegicus FF-162]
MTQKQSDITPSALALLPFGVFLCLFIGTGVYFSTQNIEFAFYQLPAPIAVLPAIMLAVLMSKDKLNTAIGQFIEGVSHRDITAMCLIYLLAGAFSAVAKATGGVDATVNLGLAILPSSFILPGLFLISAFIATSMGTSMGTIAAVAPVALGIADSTGIDAALMAGVVLSGAMFGDNLSIISDTTIAATRSQGCHMKDKFRENVKIAVPAALVTLLIFFFANEVTQAPVAGEIDWLAVLPYLTILALAVYGINVFVVLTIGIVFAGVVGLAQTDGYSVMTFSQDVYAGFGNMQEIFLLSLLIGGLAELMRQQGGLAFVTEKLSKLILSRADKSAEKGSPRASEAGIALLVSLTNFCTANNTVAIIVAGGVAKELSTQHDVAPKRSASLLDIFSCVIQGMLPYGAQALLLGSIFELSPLSVVGQSYYCFLLAISAGFAIARSKRQLAAK